MYGLVTAALPGMVAAVLGRSAHVTVGPTNTTGLIILASLTPWADQPELLLTAMATLTVLAGLSRLFIVALKAERLFDYVPEAVMVGFATGAAVIIALMQLDEFVGAPLTNVRNVVDSLIRLSGLGLTDIEWAAIGLSLFALASVVLGRRYFPRWPIPLMTLVISIGLILWAPWPFVQQWITLDQTTLINDGWPPLASHWPSWSMIQALIIPGFAVSFIGSLELIVTLRNRAEQRWLRAELGSQGVANLVGSFTGSFPASTSLTRSVLLDIGGTSTRWAPFIAALAVLPIILFGADLVRAIPQAVIAGLLIGIALSMLKPTQIRNVLKANSQTRTLFLVTFISTLVLNFHEAILLGATLGLGIFLFQASVPQLRRYSVDDQGWLRDTIEVDSPHNLIQISGSLYFAAARQLPERLTAMLAPKTTLITIDLTHTQHIRVAALQALQQFVAECQRQDVDIQICGHSPRLIQLARTIGIKLPWCNNRLEQQIGRVQADADYD